MFLLRQRKLNRLPHYDYSSSGWYFVTICTKYHTDYFGEIKNRKMILNKYGFVAKKYWFDIPKHFINTRLDEFIIMPNHLHGIVIIRYNNSNNIVGNADLRSLRNDNYNRSKMHLSKIIHGYKSSVSRFVNETYEYHFQWQKSFYDHIIRDEKSLNNIRSYICFNFLNWETDEENPNNTAINK